MVVMEHSRCWGELRGTLCHICRLRPLWTLDNFEFNRVPFVQGFVSLAYDCRVVDKYVGSILASDETVTFRVVEPLDLAFHNSTMHSRIYGGYGMTLLRSDPKIGLHTRRRFAHLSSFHFVRHGPSPIKGWLCTRRRM